MEARIFCQMSIDRVLLEQKFVRVRFLRMPRPRNSIYADLYVKGSHRALRTPRVHQKWRPKVIAWAGPNAFVRNRFYEIDRWYKARIHKRERYPVLYTLDPEAELYQLSLPERLAKLKSQLDDEEAAVGREWRTAVDIGLPCVPPSSSRRRRSAEQDAELRRQLELAAMRNELTLDSLELKEAMKGDAEAVSARRLLEHHGIFRDLFHPDAFFYPVVPLSVAYAVGAEAEPTGSAEHEVEYAPVFLGNVLHPFETTKAPTVAFESKEDELWTLIMTNPDGNPFKEGAEILHWMVGNIKGRQIEHGDFLCDYLQPLPFRGTGWHRVAFILFKHTGNEQIDLSRYSVASSGAGNLSERTFSTADFYLAEQDKLTPAGVAMFQTEWDSSCQQVLQNRFKMSHPLYSYDWGEQKLRKHEQIAFPEYPQPFNLYLDRYRDEEDVETELLTQRLNSISPFKKEVRPKYPALHWTAERLDYPSWQHQENRNRYLGLGKYRSLYENPLN